VQDAELGSKLLSNLVFTPSGLVSRDALDEGDVLPRNAGTADLARARLATPHGLEALAVPADDSGKLYDDEGAGGVGPKSVQHDSEHSILRAKPGALLSPAVDGKLLTQGGILQRQACPRHQRGPYESKQSR